MDSVSGFVYNFRYALAVIFMIGVCGPISQLFTSGSSAAPQPPAHNFSCTVAEKVFGSRFSYQENVGSGEDSVGDPADLGCTVTGKSLQADVRMFRATARLKPVTAYQQRIDPMADNDLTGVCSSSPKVTHVGDPNGYVATSCVAIPWADNSRASFAVLATNSNFTYVRVLLQGNNKAAGAALDDAVKLANAA